MQTEFRRMCRLTCKLESYREAENSFGFSVETPELDDQIRRCYKRLGKFRQRLGIQEEDRGIPWFQFLDMIEIDVRRFLPAEYRNYQICIGETSVDGDKTTALWLEKDGKALPALSLNEYTDRVQSGADEWQMLKIIALDYKKAIGKNHSDKCHQMER